MQSRFELINRPAFFFIMMIPEDAGDRSQERQSDTSTGTVDCRTTLLFEAKLKITISVHFVHFVKIHRERNPIGKILNSGRLHRHFVCSLFSNISVSSMKIVSIEHGVTVLRLQPASCPYQYRGATYRLLVQLLSFCCHFGELATVFEEVVRSAGALSRLDSYCTAN